MKLRCANEYPMGIAGVILKSDMDEKVLFVKRIIPKGECKVYGAVMKAKDGKTLGGNVIENHEAIQKMLELKDTNLPKYKFKAAMQEWHKYHMMSGFNPR